MKPVGGALDAFAEMELRLPLEFLAGFLRAQVNVVETAAGRVA